MNPGGLRLRRRPVNYTSLPPHGVRLTFNGYLPDKPCPSCKVTWPAAAYAKQVRIQGRRHLLDFGEWCLQCDPPTIREHLNGVRPTSTYTDATGRIVGWRQRDRSGPFGEELRLELMELRKTADGVYRPQPKLDRRAKAQQQAEPRAPKPFRAIHDYRRVFSKPTVTAQALTQGNQCLACGEPFTATNQPVGGHRVSFADGGATVPSNCIALCCRCNSEMGRRSFHEFMRDNRRLF